MKCLLFFFFVFNCCTSFAQKQVEITVHFDLDQYAVRPAESKKLDSLSGQFSKLPAGFSVSIFGHCDVRGGEAYNQVLSENRVRAVKKYLVDKGLDPNTILKEQGFGKMQPLADARTEFMHALNRRVEIRITLPEEKPVSPPPVPETPPVEKPAPTITKAITDTAVKAGSLITLRNLNFYGGRHILLESSIPVLEELLAVMNNNPSLVIAVEGHVCCIFGDNDGTDFDTNLANLSEARARVVYAYLLKNGIAASRISYRGFGHSRPLYPYPEKSAVEQSLNRRVEIRIISK